MSRETLNELNKILDMKISFFKNSFAKEPVVNDTIGSYFNSIRNEIFASRIEEWRRNQKAELAAKKKLLPSVIMSGMFTGRKDRDLVPGSYTNIMVLDLDWKDNFGLDLDSLKSYMTEDPNVICVHRSVSGEGLAIYVYTSIPHNQYPFVRIAFEKKYGIVLDAATNNVGRLRYISSDPGLLINTDVEPYHKVEVIEYTKTATTTGKHGSFYSVKVFVDELAEKEIDITSGYTQWHKVGIAISIFGEAGRELFHITSSVNGEYDVDKTNQQYDRILSMDKPMVKLSYLWYLKKKL